MVQVYLIQNVFFEIIAVFSSSEKKHASPVAILLGEIYPAMFHYDGAEEDVPSFVGYGLGGLKGLKGLPDRICNRVIFFLI